MFLRRWVLFFLPMYVAREIREKFAQLAGVYNVVALVGPRQAGKTTFLRHAMKGKNAAYVVFDDPDAKSLFEEDIKKFEQQYLEGKRLGVLDEVQECREAGARLKYLADKGRKLWVTASSEALLGRETLARLVGRVGMLRLYPFSLAEFLAAKKQKAFTAKILQRRVWEHIAYGGYPRVVTTRAVDMKKQLLRDLYETMLLKDAAYTFSIEDVDALDALARRLAHGVGARLSYEKLSRALGLSFPTLKKYLAAMEKSYFIKKVSPFFTSKAKEIAKQPKAYFVDTGLRNAVARRFPSEPEGRLFENYVFTELLKRGHAPKYWQSKGGAEVDFVVEREGKPVPVEAKLRASPPKVTRGLRSFIRAYAPARAVVATYHESAAVARVHGCRVAFTTLEGLGAALGEKESAPAFSACA